jgi:hypothetical protein
MTKRTMKARKWIVAGMSAGALVGGVAGFMVTVPGAAGAATSAARESVSDTDTATEIDATVEAQHHGRPYQSPEERAAKLSEVMQSIVDDGTITAVRRDAVIAVLQAARPDHVEGEGGHGGRRGRLLEAGLDTAATVIGIMSDELKTALQSGKSIADVATANGVDPQTVIDALVAEAASEFTQRITDMVNGVRPADPAGPVS